MVAMSLVDSVFSNVGSAERSTRAVALLAQAALKDLAQIEKLDDALAPDDPAQFDRGAASLMRSEFERWAAYTASLLERIDRFAAINGPVAGVKLLHRAYGKTRARLSISLDDMEQSYRALAEGRTVSGEEVRRDLFLRVH